MRHKTERIKKYYKLVKYYKISKLLEHLTVLKYVTRTYSQMHHTDKYPKHS